MSELSTKRAIRSAPYLRRIRSTGQKQDQTGTHISQLPSEMLELIFINLPVQDRGRAAQVCRTWREVADQRSVWKNCEVGLHLRGSLSPILLTTLNRRGIRRLKVKSFEGGLKDAVAGIPGLESLSLSRCDNVMDSDLICAFETEIPSLIRLELTLCTHVTDDGMLLMAQRLSQLRKLSLHSCFRVTDAGIAHLCGDGKAQRGTLLLEYLSLQYCTLLTDDALLCVSTGLPKLRSINLSCCLSITDSGLGHLAKLPELTKVNLHQCRRVSDAGVAALAKCGHLEDLDVSYCDRVGDEALGLGFIGLKSLNLRATSVTDEGLEKVILLPDLETLDIGECSSITDRGVKALAKGLSKLKAIDLDGCDKILEWSSLDSLLLLPKLEVVNGGVVKYFFELKQNFKLQNEPFNKFFVKRLILKCFCDFEKNVLKWDL